LSLSVPLKHTWDIFLTSARDGRDLLTLGTALYIRRKKKRVLIE